MSQQAGWYDDPQDDSNLRYWDGVQWTNHTSPKQKPGLDQAGQASAQQGWHQQGSAGHGGQSQGQYGQQHGHNPYGQPQDQNPYGQQQGHNPYAGQTGQNPYQGQWGGAPMPGMGYQPQAADPRSVTPDGQPLAGWWHRVGARVIDGLIMLPITLVVGFTFMGDFFSDYMNWSMTQTDPFALPPAELSRGLGTFAMLTGLAAFAYEVVLTTLAGGTLGKLATGLRVRLREEPGKIGWGPSVMRALVYQGPSVLANLSMALNFLGLFTLINVLWPLWDTKRQALHDKVAKTNVVRNR